MTHDDPDGAATARTTGPEADANASQNGASSRIKRVVLWLLGLDLFVLLVPRSIEQLAPYVVGLTRLLDAGGMESVVVLSFVIGYAEIVWLLGWLVLAAIAVWYAPKLIRPGATTWPSSYLVRAVMVVPILWSGLLAETAYRSVLDGIVGPIAVPVALPLTPLTVGGNLAAVAVLFAWVLQQSDERLSPGERNPLGYVLRGVALVAILGLFFGLFSLITPFGEVFAVVSYLLSSSEIPSDPAERLIEGATTIWKRNALAVMTVYLAAMLVTTGSVMLAARLRVPAGFVSAAPISALLLVLFGVSAGGYTYLYCERTLRQFRQNFDPTVDPTVRVSGMVIPIAVLISLVAGEYVFADPTVGPGLASGIIGVFAVTAATFELMINIGQKPDENDGKSSKQWEICDRELAAVGKHMRTDPDDPRRTLVAFDIVSRHDEPLDVRVTDTVPAWLDPKTIEFDGDEPGAWDVEWDELSHETTLPPEGIRTLRYEVSGHDLAIGPERGTRDLHHGTHVELGRQSASIESETCRDNPDTINIPSYHLPPIAIGIFFGLLGAAAPLEGVFPISEWVDGTPGGYPLGETGARFLLISSLVVCSYVPFGISTHLDELRESGVGFSTETTQWGPSARRFRLVSAASLIAAVGIAARLAGPLPVSAPFDRWIPWVSGAGAIGLLFAAYGVRGAFNTAWEVVTFLTAFVFRELLSALILVFGLMYSLYKTLRYILSALATRVTSG